MGFLYFAGNGQLNQFMFPVKLIYSVLAGNAGGGRQVGTHRSLGQMQRERRILPCLMTTTI
jgi:hypothetical protein